MSGTRIRPRGRRHERGSALLMALVAGALALLVYNGVASMTMTNVLRTGFTYNDARALENAQTGLEVALHELNTYDGALIYTQPGWVNDPTNTTHIFNSAMATAGLSDEYFEITVNDLQPPIVDPDGTGQDVTIAGRGLYHGVARTVKVVVERPNIPQGLWEHGIATNDKGGIKIRGLTGAPATLAVVDTNIGPYDDPKRKSQQPPQAGDLWSISGNPFIDAAWKTYVTDVKRQEAAQAGVIDGAVKMWIDFTAASPSASELQNPPYWADPVAPAVAIYDKHDKTIADPKDVDTKWKQYKSAMHKDPVYVAPDFGPLIQNPVAPNEEDHLTTVKLTANPPQPWMQHQFRHLVCPSDSPDKRRFSSLSLTAGQPEEQAVELLLGCKNGTSVPCDTDFYTIMQNGAPVGIPKKCPASDDGVPVAISLANDGATPFTIDGSAGGAAQVIVNVPTEIYFAGVSKGVPLIDINKGGFVNHVQKPSGAHDPTALAIYDQSDGEGEIRLGPSEPFEGVLYSAKGKVIITGDNVTLVGAMNVGAFEALDRANFRFFYDTALKDAGSTINGDQLCKPAFGIPCSPKIGSLMIENQ